MTRRVKTLWLTAMAVFAFSAVAASAAQAEVLFHSEVEKTTITAKNEPGSNSVFDAAGSSISCTTASFEGFATAKTTSTLTVKPSYSGCTFLGVANVPVNTNGCEFVFHANGEVDIAGSSCTAITFEAASCKVSVGPQTGLKSVTFKTIGTGTGREVTVTPGPVEKIKYTSSGLCVKNGTFSDGQYTSGNAIATGEKTGTTTMVGIWWE